MEDDLLRVAAAAELRSEINLEKGSSLTAVEVSAGTSLMLASSGFRVSLT